jgi:polysaccharide deacetylase family protein (PEP-CTERM system associated)
MGVIALTINVEETFQSPALSGPAMRTSAAPSVRRVETYLDSTLAWLAEYHAKATFFMLGETAERFPELARRVVRAGHELGCYGYEGARTIDHGDGPLIADMRLAKAILEDVAGQAVSGCRVPGYAVNARNAWALDCLRSVGFRYSSSTVARPPREGYNASPIAIEARPGFYEIPVTLVRAMGFAWLAGGGEALGRLPYWLWRKQLDAAAARGATFVFNAWEFQCEQPYFQQDRAGFESGYRNAAGRARTDARIRRLFDRFGGQRIDALLPGRPEPAPK